MIPPDWKKLMLKNVIYSIFLYVASEYDSEVHKETERGLPRKESTDLTWSGHPWFSVQPPQGIPEDWAHWAWGELERVISSVSRSVVSDFFANQGTVAHQAPLSMGVSRQEYWSGLPFPSPGGLPDLGIELASPALAGRLFTAELPKKHPCLHPSDSWTCLCYSFCLECLPPPSLTTWVP